MRWSQLWFWTLAVAFVSTASAAQQTMTTAGGTAGGTSTVSVRVTYKQNHKPAAGMQVQLVSPMGGMAGIRTTDGNGGATFDGVGTGRYQILVSGPDIDTTKSDTFETGGDSGGPYLTERIEVLLKSPADGQSPGASLLPVIPDSAQKEFKLGSKEMDDKNYEEAKGHFQKAIAAFPKYAEAFNSLALAETQLNDPQDAVEAFRSATQIDPSLQRANLYLGQFYYANHQYKEAEPYLQRCAANQPQNAQLLTALANSELQNGETDLALGNARKVSSLPDHKQFVISHLIAAQALAGKGKDDEIAKEYEEYLKEAPPDSMMVPRVKEALAQLKPNK